MSSLGNWTYIYTVTFWPVSYDEFNQVAYGDPYTILCDYMVGGAAATDSSGTEFLPMSTYYFEAEEGSPLIPKPLDFIKVGDHRLFPDPFEIGAERIKKVGHWPMGAFGAGELPDWQILT